MTEFILTEHVRKHTPELCDWVEELGQAVKSGKRPFTVKEARRRVRSRIRRELLSRGIPNYLDLAIECEANIYQDIVDQINRPEPLTPSERADALAWLSDSLEVPKLSKMLNPRYVQFLEETGTRAEEAKAWEFMAWCRDHKNVSRVTK